MDDSEGLTMRSIRFAALIILFALSGVGSLAQTRRVYTGGDSLTATTSWVKYQAPGPFERIIGFAVDHDGFTGDLYIGIGTGFNVDTTSGQRIILKPYESISWVNLSIDALWVRSNTGTVPFRLRYW